AAWLPVLRTLGTQPWFGGRLQVGPGSKVFDEAGELIDPKVRAQLESYVVGFARFVAGASS
ncbi:MAG: NAD(P)H-dependent oxidoreductase, partial [Kofleriaceae bacterium]